MKTIYIYLLLLFTTMTLLAQEKETILLLETDFGNVKLKLYNDTPKHRDNFLKLVDSDFYKDLLFHRVINQFMIQGGDSTSRLASDTAIVGGGDLGYYIDAEFRFPKLYHRRGVLAAARMGDAQNPEKASSASQFYIVTGKAFTDEQLNQLERTKFEQLKSTILKRLQSENTSKIKELYSAGDKVALAEYRTALLQQAEDEAGERRAETLYNEEQRDAYRVIGGTPHLDGGYTVFGEVIEGLTVIDQIEQVPTNGQDRPLKNVRMRITRCEE